MVVVGFKQCVCLFFIFVVGFWFWRTTTSGSLCGRLLFGVCIGLRCLFGVLVVTSRLEVG
jgi:hypothetical protein